MVYTYENDLNLLNWYRNHFKSSSSRRTVPSTEVQYYPGGLKIGFEGVCFENLYVSKAWSMPYWNSKHTSAPSTTHLVYYTVEFVGLDSPFCAYVLWMYPICELCSQDRVKVEKDMKGLSFQAWSNALSPTRMVHICHCFQDHDILCSQLHLSKHLWRMTLRFWIEGSSQNIRSSNGHTIIAPHWEKDSNCRLACHPERLHPIT